MPPVELTTPELAEVLGLISRVGRWFSLSRNKVLRSCIDFLPLWPFCRRIEKSIVLLVLLGFFSAFAEFWSPRRMSNIVPLISILSLIDLVGDLGTSFLDVKEAIDSEDRDLL